MLKEAVDEFVFGILPFESSSRAGEVLSFFIYDTIKILFLLYVMIFIIGVIRTYFPLEKIKLTVNLDMVGTGQQGVILFNAPQRPLEAALVQKINEEKHYMVEVEERPAKPNSDHWPFHMKGIPAIFFLTKGRSGGGHSIFDTPDKLPLYGYENLFKLVLDLIRELERQEPE